MCLVVLVSPMASSIFHLLHIYSVLYSSSRNTESVLYSYNNNNNSGIITSINWENPLPL